jgi:hypothetical protein
MAIGVDQASQSRNKEALPPLYDNGHTGENFGDHALELAEEFLETFLDPNDTTDFDPETGFVFFDYPDVAHPERLVRRSENLRHYLNLCLGGSGINAALAPAIMFHLGRKIDTKIAELEADQTVAANSHNTFALKEQNA